MPGSLWIASKWSASNWKVELELLGHSLIFAFCDSLKVGSLHFITLTFLKRTSYFLANFLMPFIFCPAKQPLVHACLTIQDLYKPRAGVGKWVSPSATERWRLRRSRFSFHNDPCFWLCSLTPIEPQQSGLADHVCPVNSDAGSVPTQVRAEHWFRLSQFSHVSASRPFSLAVYHEERKDLSSALKM